MCWYVLAEQEYQQRHQARLWRLLHEVQLPVPKTLADYDWAALPDLDRYQIEQVAHDTGWLDRAENLLLFAPSRVGKTRLAAGISRSLIALDRPARFFSVTTLVQELQRAKADYALAKALTKLDRYALQATAISVRTAHLNQPVEVPSLRRDFARPLEAVLTA